MELDLVGQTLASRYLIESRLGDGGMGAVFRARHVKVGRLFAVKVLHPRLLERPKQVLRFEREANLAGALRHPHVAAVVDVGELGGLRYLVMEHAVGEPLSALIARGPLGGERMLRIAHQLCEGLGHAHARDVIHRDFKPDNVIVERCADGTDFARIIDFGIAILREELSDTDKDRLTTDGVILGTPHYMAPEQAFGGPFDHRVDLFALGITCYEMLTGRLPFDGDAVTVARANISMATPPMGVRAPALDIDPLLEAFTRALMAKSPAERPASAHAAAGLLELVERDRAAAADALGLDRESVVDWSPAMPSRTGESKPIAREPRDTDELDPRSIKSQRLAAREPLGTDAVMPLVVDQASPRRRRWVVAAVAGALLVTGGVLAAVLRPSRKPDQVAAAADARRAEPAAVDIAPVAIADAYEEPVADAALPAEPADAPVARADARERIVVADARVGVADAAVPRPVVDAAVATVVRDAAPAEEPAPTARAVADLYMAVGRELKTFSDRNAGTAAPLWARYRLIKINDAMATPGSQRAALRELASIRSAIPK